MIEITVNNQDVEFTSISETVENTENLYSVLFNFSNDWNGFTKYAVFKNLSCENEIQVSIPNNNAVLIPNEILKTQGLLQVGVYGYYGNVFKPTTYTSNTILIKRGVNVNANNPHEFTPSEFFRLLTNIENVKTDLTNHINNFDNPHNVTKSQIGLNNVENKSADDILAELELGGTNLYLHTKEYDGTLYLGWVSLDPVTERAIPPYTYINGFGVQRIATAWFDLSQQVILEPNTDYTLSAWVRWENEVGEMRFYAGEGTEGSPFISANVTKQIGTENFKRVSYTYNTGSSVISTCRFECSTNAPYLIYGLKLEKGNKSSAWSPSPFDTPDFVIVGGRNLLLNTSNPITFTTDNVVSNTYIGDMTPTPYFFSKNNVGQWVTISFDYDVTDAEGQFQVNWYGTPWTFCGGSRYEKITEPNQKGRYVRTRQIMLADAEIPTNRKLSVVLNGFKGTITISNIKLEFGNVPSDWTPAPEDIQERLSTIEATLISMGGG